MKITLLAILYLLSVISIILLEKKAWIESNYNKNELRSNTKHEIVSWLNPISLVLLFDLAICVFSDFDINRTFIYVLAILISLVIHIFLQIKLKKISDNKIP